MSNNNPIGIFDSGVGGLTVARAMAQLMPNERFIYFGDTAHLPYGDKSAEAIKKYSLAIADFLVQRGAKALVIACNSASAVAFAEVKKALGKKVPVFNVIDPVVDFVANRGFERVGVIGTRATVQSNAYANGIAQKSSRIATVSMATPLLVPIIEEGLAKNEIGLQAVHYYLQQPQIQNIDALVLGCTHYPILYNAILNELNGTAEVLDSPTLVAREIKKILAQKGMNAEGPSGSHEFFVSDFTPTFEQIATQFFGENIALREQKLT